MTEHFTRDEAVALIQEQIGTATAHLLADRAVNLLSAAVSAKLKEWEAQGAVVKWIPTAQELGAPQVEPAPSQEQALQRLSDLGQQLQPEEFGTAPTGCAHCQNPLYAGTKCKNCGRVSEVAPSTAGERDEIIQRLYEESQENPDDYRYQAAALLQSTADHISDAGKMVAEIRDIFPIPAPGSPLERAWMEAMGEPESVPDYVRACVAALPVGELTDEQLRAAILCREAEKVSVSMVQRTLNIGYNAAQEPCQSIIDAGLVPGLTIAPSLTAASSQPTTEESLVVAGAQPGREPNPMSDDEIKKHKPVCADLTSFRAGIRWAERAHGITKKGEQ